MRAPLEVAPAFPFLSRLAQCDYRLLVYMDDILVVSYMLDHACTKALLSLMAELFDLFGVMTNAVESVTLPVTQIDYLGMCLLMDGKLCLTEKCISKIWAELHSLLCYTTSHCQFVPMPQLRACAGLASTTYACC